MPAVESLLKALGIAEKVPGEPSAGAMPGRPHNHSAFGDLMAKILPEDAKHGTQNFQSPGQKPNAAKKQNPAADPQTENLLESTSPGDELMVALLLGKSRSESNPAAETPAKKSGGANDADLPVNQLPAPNELQALPVFLTLPILAHFTPVAGKTGPAKNNLNTAPILGKIGAVMPEAETIPGKTTPDLRPENLANKADVKLDVSSLIPAEEKKFGTQTPPSTSQPVPGPKLPQAANIVSTLLKADPSQVAETPPDAKPPVENLQVVSTPPTPTSPESAVDENAGTGVAIDADAMKNLENANKFAGSGMKNLPGGKIDPAHAPVPQLQLVAAPSRDNSGSDLNFSSGGNTNSPAVHDAGTLVSTPSLTTDAHVRTAERTSEMVALHAVRLARSDMDSLSVVIKPGAGTELSLELRQKNGGIEAQAVLQRGDFQALNQHWPDLQQKLEQRGIKLAPLGGENNLSSGDLGQFSRGQKNQSNEESAQQASAFAEFTVAINRGGATARLATVASATANEWWA